MQALNPKIYLGPHFVVLFIMGYVLNGFIQYSRPVQLSSEVTYYYSEQEFVHLDKASDLTDFRDKNQPIRYRKDLEAALNECDLAIKINAKNGGAYANRAYAKLYLNDSKGSKLDFSKAIELEPNRSIFYLGRAVTSYYDLNDLNSAIKINPLRSYYYQARGNGKCLKHDYLGAFADYYKAITLDSTAIKGCLKDCQYFSNCSLSELHQPYELL